MSISSVGGKPPQSATIGKPDENKASSSPTAAKAAGVFRRRHSLPRLDTTHSPSKAPWKVNHPDSPPLLNRPSSTVTAKPSKPKAQARAQPPESPSEDVGTASSQLQSAGPIDPPGTLSPSVIDPPPPSPLAAAPNMNNLYLANLFNSED